MDKKYQLENYIFIGEIGKGSFSRIYKAQEITTGNYYAIKIIDNAKKYEKILVKEIQLLKLLNHINIIKLKETITKDKIKYIVLEYCSRGDLSKYIIKRKDKEGNPFNKGMETMSIISIVKQIVQGIKYLRSKNIIHRDLKPANILLTDNGTIRIADLGFAKEQSMDQMSKTICGSPIYMAPEILNSKPCYTPKSDLWSLGIMFYQFIFGETPYRAKNIIQLIGIYSENPVLKFPKSKRKRELENTGLLDIISRLIVVNPDKRMSFEELFNDPFFNVSNKNTSTDNNRSNESNTGNKLNNEDTENNTLNNEDTVNNENTVNSTESNENTVDNFEEIKQEKKKVDTEQINFIRNYEPYTPQVKPISLKTNPFKCSVGLKSTSNLVYGHSFTKTFIPISGSASIPDIFNSKKNPLGLQDSKQERSNKESNTLNRTKYISIKEIYGIVKKVVYFMYRDEKPEEKLSLGIHINRLIREIINQETEKTEEYFYLKNVYHSFTSISKEIVKGIKIKEINTLETIYNMALETGRSACVSDLLKFKDTALRDYTISLGLFLIIEKNLGKKVEITHYIECIESRIKKYQ